MVSKIQPNQHQDIIDLYTSGKILKEIAEIYNVSRETVAKILRKNSVEIWDKRHVHPRDYDRVLSLYAEGRTMKNIAEILGEVSAESVAKIIKKFGIVPENGNTRRANFGAVQDYFEKDSEGAAYFTGLLLADGNISAKGKISIGLQSNDKHILESMKDELKLPTNISDFVRKDGEKSSTLSFNVTGISESLSKLGMFPNKSLKEIAPIRFIENRHFWRGMVDGDGSIGIQTNKSARVYLCGSKEVCSQFLEYCKKLVPEIKTEVKVSNGDLYRVSISGIKAAKVLRVLYGDSELFLNRKSKKAQEVFEKYGV